jgi:hypothetical protein
MRILRSLGRPVALALAGLLLFFQLADPAAAGRKGFGTGFRKGSQTTIGVPAGAIPYNALFGVTDPTTGWIDFPLHSGNRRVYANNRPGEGSDSNNCLSAATACATFDHAFDVYSTGHTGSDQLMIAGKSTTPYSDNGLHGDQGGMLGKASGISKTYPNAVLSYDPTDAANSAKYGKLVGPDMPVLQMGSTTGSGKAAALSMIGTTGSSNFCIQGLAVDAQGQPGISLSYLGSSTGLLRTGLCFQNMRFQGVRLTLNLGDNGDADPSPEHGTYGGDILLSKSSGWGQWDPTGNYSWLFVDRTDGYHEQEIVGIHSGWKIDVPRTADFSVGGPTAFGHGRYFGAENRHGKSDFAVWGDNAIDGDNARGNMAENYSVHINEPSVGTTGGFSSSIAEAPLGVTITRNTGLVIGGGFAVTAGDRGDAWGDQNTKPGSIIDNYLMLANPYRGAGGNRLITACSRTGMIDQYLTMSRITAFGYANTLTNDIAANSDLSCAELHPDKINITWVNDKLDVLAPGTGNSVSASSDFLSPWTSVNQLVSAMSMTSVKQLYNTMLYRPDLPWARAMITAAFTAHSKAQPLSGVPPPNLAGITPAAVYTPTPILSSPIGTKTGATTATIGATTDQATGFLYGVVTASSTAPTATQVKTGKDNAGSSAAFSGSIAVSSTGAKTISATGLAPSTTYYAHLTHLDLFDDPSTVVTSASFTTDAGVAATTFDPTHSNLTLSSGNLVASNTVGQPNKFARSTVAHSGSGDWTAHFTMTNGPGTYIGFANASCATDGSDSPLSSSNFIGWLNFGDVSRCRST